MTMTDAQTVKQYKGLVMKIAKEWSGRGVDFLDLCQEGYIGLLHAKTKFDPHRGTKFSTYAYPWVRKKIRVAALSQGSTVRTPLHVQYAENKKKRLAATLQTKYGHEFKVASSAFVAFDETFHAPGIDDDVTLEQEFLTAVSALSWSEAFVIRMHKIEGKTLRECGEVLNLTRQRVFQIEQDALDVLRQRVKFNDLFCAKTA